MQYLCRCMKISLDQLEELIDSGLDFLEIQARTKIGTKCSSCTRKLIKRLADRGFENLELDIQIQRIKEVLSTLQNSILSSEGFECVFVDYRNYTLSIQLVSKNNISEEIVQILNKTLKTVIHSKIEVSNVPDKNLR